MGDRRLDEPSPSEIRQLISYVKTHVVARRNARGGRSAQEHLVAALRCLYRRAVDDGLINEADNPAQKVAKPRRLPTTRRALPDTRLRRAHRRRQRGRRYGDLRTRQPRRGRRRAGRADRRAPPARHDRRMVTGMAALTVSVPPAVDPGLRGPVPARTSGPAAADRVLASARPGRAVRSWPLLVLAVPAAAEVWSGWVGIAQKTGFGLVSPLPGILPSLHLDTAITLPVGVEAYAASALRAWLASDQLISGRTRRFAKWSAICSDVILSFRVSRGCDLRRLAEDTVLGETCEALSCLFQRG